MRSILMIHSVFVIFVTCLCIKPGYNEFKYHGMHGHTPTLDEMGGIFVAKGPGRPTLISMLFFFTKVLKY